MLRILLVKPYQPSIITICQPPLGLLYLTSYLREQLEEVHVEVFDMRLEELSAHELAHQVDIGSFDLVGISALNFEAEAAHEIGNIIKQRWPEVITALGGPYAHSSLVRALESGGFDWVFDGEAERTFASALRIHFVEQRNLREVPGLTWWHQSGNEYIQNGGYDSIPDLDALPLPAWDLVDFKAYARLPNQNGWLRGNRYAAIFTSRGCPYKCSYCHDIFGKKFRWRSAENVLEEITLLNREYGVDEIQIIDDIFNLHKPRMRDIAHRVIEKFGERQLFFCFPNGIRADIFEPEDIPLMARMGVFQITVAIETITPRLQDLIQKDLKLDRATEIIEECDKYGILSKGFFMIGFPTETLQEIENTIRYAVDSPLTWAGIFLVVPQEGTPLHELALNESPVALEHITLRDYYSDTSWYQHAYNVDLQKIQKRAFCRFYLRPWRIWRIATHVNFMSLLRGIRIFFNIVTVKSAEPRNRNHSSIARSEQATVGTLPGNLNVKITQTRAANNDDQITSIPLSKIGTRKSSTVV